MSILIQKVSSLLKKISSPLYQILFGTKTKARISFFAGLAIYIAFIYADVKIWHFPPYIKIPVIALYTMYFGFSLTTAFPIGKR